MNRYSFSGKGNILIKATTAGSYGEKTFAANEPIAYFTDVLIDINFNNIEKTARSGAENLLSDSSSEPSYLRVQNIKVTESLQSLLYKKQINNTRHKTHIKLLQSSDGAMFLPIEIDENLNDYLFIYNSNKVKVTDYTVSDSGLISGLPDGGYTVFYSVETLAQSTYFLDAPIMPYLAAEISVIGNTNDENGEMIAHIHKLKINSTPSLDFNSDNPFVDSLDFVIIKDKDPIEVNYYAV